MKFGAVTDDVNAFSYKVVTDYQAPAYPIADTIQQVTHIDGTVEFVNFGARIKKEAEFTLVQMSKAEYLALFDYVNSHIGSKIKITEENIDEKIFSEDWEPTVYYCYLLEESQLQEEDFSSSRKLFSATIKLSLAGENITDEVNPEDSAELDVLFEVDTVRADFNSSTDPVGMVEGNIWYNTVTKVVKVYTSSLAWKELYTVADDDATYGFIAGKFYWSAFSKLDDYIAGLINHTSIDLGNRSIDIKNGPNMSFREGISFSLRDNDRFWKFIIDEGINLFGAKIVVKIYRKSDTSYKTIFTGRNRTNQFDYENYKFSVESFFLNEVDVFPKNKIDPANARYTDVSTNFIGRSVFETYGTHDTALLQNVSSDRNTISVLLTNNDVSDTFSARIHIANPLYIVIDVGSINADIIAAFANGTYCLQILHDNITDSENEGKVRVIASLSTSVIPGSTVLILTEAFETVPLGSETMECSIIQAIYKFQVSENPCGGFVNSSGQMRLYGISSNSREVLNLPSSFFVQSADKSNLNLLPAKAADPDNNTTFTELKPFTGSVISKKISGIQYPNPIDFGKGVGKDFELSEGEVWFSWNYSWISSGATHSYTTQDAPDYLPEFVEGNSIWNEEKETMNAKGKNGFKSIRKLTQRYNYPNSTTTPPRERDLTNSLIYCFRYDINKLGVNNFVVGDEIFLSVNLLIQNFFWFRGYLKNDLEVGRGRIFPAGLKMKMRLVKKDLSGGEIVYLEDPSWVHDLEPGIFGIKDQVSVLNAPNYACQLYINNTGENFKDDADELVPYWDNMITGYYYNAAAVFPYDVYHVVGDKVFFSADGKIHTYAGAHDWGSGDSVDPGTILYLLPIRFSAIPAPNDDVRYYKVVDGSPRTLVLATSAEYTTVQTFNGKDLFDVTSYVNSLDQVSSIEFLFGIEDPADTPWSDDIFISGIASDSYQYYLEHQFTVDQIGEAVFYKQERSELTDKPMFSYVDGKTLVAGITQPYDVFNDIINQMYPGKYSSLSLQTLMSAASRMSWVWRKQFIESLSVNTVFKELLFNAWACAVISPDDEWVFKSLISDDYSGHELYTFTDAIIISDSLKAPTFRDADKIFQKFEFYWKYNPISKEIKTANEYLLSAKMDFDKAIIPSNVDTYFYNDEVKKYLDISTRLYGITNTYKGEFNYFYDQAYPPIESIIKYLSMNGWTLTFDISLTYYLDNNIELMDYIAISSYFFTNNSKVFGFITQIKPLVYSGIVSLTVFCPEPPGALGPFPEQFKDALSDQRVITTWEANGYINDAGLDTRTTAEYAEDDADTDERVL